MNLKQFEEDPQRHAAIVEIKIRATIKNVFMGLENLNVKAVQTHRKLFLKI